MRKISSIIFITLMYTTVVYAASEKSIDNARNAEAVGNFKKASLYYRAAREHSKYADIATFGLVRSLLEVGEVDEAEHLISEYINKTNPLNAESHFLMADVHIKKNRYSEALVSVKTAEDLQPSSPAIIEKRGVAYFKMGKVKESLPMLSQAIATRPTWNLHFYRAQAYMALSDWPAAVEDLKYVIDEKPDNNQAKALLADCYIKQEKWVEADKMLQHLFKLNHKDTATISKLADVYAATNKTQERLNYLQKLIFLEPNNLAFGQKLSDSYIALKMYKLAEEELVRQLTVNPGYDEAAKRMDYLLTEQNKYEQLGVFLKKFSETFPDRAWARDHYVLLLIKFGQFHFADNFLKENFNSDHRDYNYHLLQGLARYKAGNPKGAIQTLTDANKKWAEDSYIKFNLALAYEKANDPKKAIKLYRNIPASHALFDKANVNLALALEKEGDYSSALGALQSISTNFANLGGVKNKISDLINSENRNISSTPKEGKK